MSCQFCGSKNTDDAKFCTSCGAKLNAEQAKPALESDLTTNLETNQSIATKKFSGKAIAGFVLSLVGIVFAGMICGILGIILSAVGMKEIKIKDLKGKGLAIAGLVISIIDVVIMLIYYSL